MDVFWLLIPAVSFGDGDIAVEESKLEGDCAGIWFKTLRLEGIGLLGARLGVLSLAL